MKKILSGRLLLFMSSVFVSLCFLSGCLTGKTMATVASKASSIESNNIIGDYSGGRSEVSPKVARFMVPTELVISRVSSIKVEGKLIFKDTLNGTVEIPLSALFNQGELKQWWGWNKWIKLELVERGDDFALEGSYRWGQFGGRIKLKKI